MTDVYQQSKLVSPTPVVKKRHLAEWEISSIMNNNESITTVIFPSSQQTESIEVQNEQMK